MFAHSIDEIIENREGKNMPFKVFECKKGSDCTFKVCNYAHYDSDNVMRELQYFRDLQGVDPLDEYPCLDGEPDLILRIKGTFRQVKPRVPDCQSKRIAATDKQKKQMSPESTATSSNEMLGENMQKSPKSDRSNKSGPDWADMISDDESSKIEPIPSLASNDDELPITKKEPKPSLDVDNIAKTESATLPVRDAWDDDEQNTQLDDSESKFCQKEDDKKKDNKKKDDKKKDDKKKDDHHHVKNDHEKHSNGNSCEEPPTEEPLTEEPLTEEQLTEEQLTEKQLTEKSLTEEPLTEEDDSLLMQQQQQQQQQQQYMKMIMIPFESNPQVLQKLTEILRDMAELRREVADLRREINDKKQ